VRTRLPPVGASQLTSPSMPFTIRGVPRDQRVSRGVVDAVSGTDQSPEGTVSSNTTSRRTFLKGVGLATAAGVAAPLLASTSARGGGGPLVLGINAPGPWERPPPNGTATPRMANNGWT
jgi:hypothetical protein